MTTLEQAGDVRQFLASAQQELVDFLRCLVLAESPSLIPATQQPVFALFSEQLHSLDYEVRTIPGIETGGALYARPRNRHRGRRGQLMLGHSDTVWPVGTLSHMPAEIHDGMLTGPGVYDMKAGLSLMIYALKALKYLGMEPPLTPVLLINSDEEIGSIESNSYIRLLARNVERVFVLEPALGSQGLLKTARKGVGEFHVKVKGRAAHAGLEPERGASAILELSHVIQSLFALNDPERGTTVNVGTIDGGLRTNVVAPESSAVIDVRVTDMEEAKRIERAIHGLKPEVPGVSLDIRGNVGRPPMERTARNRLLWRTARALGKSLDLDLKQGLSGGASDGNTTSLFTATLDGLGAVGGGAHAQHEFVWVDRLSERAALLALLLMSPSNGSGRSS